MHKNGICIALNQGVFTLLILFTSVLFPSPVHAGDFDCVITVHELTDVRSLKDKQKIDLEFLETSKHYLNHCVSTSIPELQSLTRQWSQSVLDWIGAYQAHSPNLPEKEMRAESLYQRLLNTRKLLTEQSESEWKSVSARSHKMGESGVASVQRNFSRASRSQISGSSESSNGSRSLSASTSPSLSANSLSPSSGGDHSAGGGVMSAYMNATGSGRSSGSSSSGNVDCFDIQNNRNSVIYYLFKTIDSYVSCIQIDRRLETLDQYTHTLEKLPDFSCRVEFIYADGRRQVGVATQSDLISEANRLTTLFLSLKDKKYCPASLRGF